MAWSGMNVIALSVSVQIKGVISEDYKPYVNISTFKHSYIVDVHHFSVPQLTSS